MADSEPNRQQGGRVAIPEQIMTPCPSPDEAVRFAGEEKTPQNEVANIQSAPATDNPVVARVDGASMTADIPAINDNHHPDRNATNKLATSPAASASTLNTDDNPVVIKDDEEAAAQTLKNEEEDDDDDDDYDSGTQPQQTPEEAVVVAATEPPAPLVCDSQKTPLDPEFLQSLDQPLELSNLDLQLAENEDPTGIVSTADLIQTVTGGAWYPTNPESGITPRIEAFAKLEFHYGQDFYLSSVNIVLGRQDKEPSLFNGKRKKRRQENHYGDSVLVPDEIKVPLFPPPDIDVASISRRHLRIQYDYELSTWKLTALCDTGFRLTRSGKDKFFSIGKMITLENSDHIRFGNLAFTWFLPDQDESEQQMVDDDVTMEDGIERKLLDAMNAGDLSSDLDSDNDSDDGDDEDEGSDLDSREQSHDNGTPTPRSSKFNGDDDSSLMPPPPVKRGRGRPPKNGISVREQKLLKRQAQEEFLANGGNVANLDMSKYGNLPVDKLFAKEGEKMAQQIEKEARKRAKAEEKEAKIREKQAAKDLKPPKIPKERKRKRTKSPPAREEDYTPEQLAKPSLPYTVMIYDAIQNSEKKALTLPEIYRSLETTYPYFKVRAETTGWQSSVRHNLRGSGEGGGSSLFERGERSGKGYIWKIAKGANIDKERKKRKPVTGSPHTTQASMQAAPQPQMTIPSGGSWSQSAQTSQFGHPAQFAQQYQSHQTVQTFAQTTYQAKAPTAPTVQIPKAATTHSIVTTTTSDHSTIKRAVAQPAVPPPPAWNPAQAKPQITQASVPNGGVPARIPQQTRAPVAPQVQPPARQHQVNVATLQQARAAAPVTASSAPIPGSAVPAARPPAAIAIQPSPATKPAVSSEVDSKARDLLDNPTFLKIMKEHLQKYPGHNINSPEVRKALWAEFKKTTGAKAPLLKTGIAKPPVPKAPPVVQKPSLPSALPQRAALQPNPQPPPNAVPVTTPVKSAPISIPKLPVGLPNQPSMPQTPTTPQPGQIKPSTPHQTTTSEQPTSAQQRVGDLLKGMTMDAQKKAKILQFLKNAKEKKAAEAMGASKTTPISGIKRPAEAAPTNGPVAKRTAIEGQQ
ncbi:hypothetical protein H072_1144 [Dactylellina haptotyla CBS 200.50]|uniref:Fork-head domain-containing protein n=1 Tax=Dactylellina haptotyla (strain CBS 200.50) TaxID=1284197 RepID=S8CAS1_DACHA|nr:hypothetical protein H072_1144 [Dactylellina haptotyla CBS 200.50]